MTVTDAPPDAATNPSTVLPGAEPDTTTVEPAEDAEVFPREYVEKLRKESAGYRDKAKIADTRADVLSARLHGALVANTGRLADPTDLAYDVAHLDDTEALTAAIDALTEAKPHLKARKVTGDVGQGNRGDTSKAPGSFAQLFS